MKRRLLFSLSALAGAGLATLVSQTGILPGAIAASSETYRQLGLFGDVYDKVRTGYVEAPTDDLVARHAAAGRGHEAPRLLLLCPEGAHDPRHGGHEARSLRWAEHLFGAGVPRIPARNVSRHVPGCNEPRNRERQDLRFINAGLGQLGEA